MDLTFTQLTHLRRVRPLIHCISNQVSANDCANVVLAAGARPIMAQAPQGSAQISAAASATVLNTGTPTEEKFRACLLAAQEAARLDHPIILDPVGAGASPWRLDSLNRLLERMTPSILRVNLSEAQALTGRPVQEQGVDAPPASPSRRLEAALALAERFHGRTAILLTGPEDIVTDGKSAWSAAGGSERISQVTGAGCMLSALCGVFAAAEKDPLAAALLASVFWKTCAGKAAETAWAPGSFRTALIDAAGVLDPSDCAAQARVRQLFQGPAA